VKHWVGLNRRLCALHPIDNDQQLGDLNSPRYHVSPQFTLQGRVQ